jgi:hypothetical protein
MQTVSGVFRSRTYAEVAVADLVNHGIPQSSIIFLSSEPAPLASIGGVNRQEAVEEKLEGLPTTDAEADGMGKGVGALMGGGVGATAGWAAGAAVANLLLPGVGMVFALGLGGAALLGLGGAVAGAEVGELSEHALDTGIPKDDVTLYRQLLKEGWSLVVVSVDDEELAKSAKLVMNERDGESPDEVRKQLRPAA